MTSIEWVRNDDGTLGVTWNPVRGCKLVSPGCANCYAMGQAHRFSGKGGPYEGLTQLRSKGKGAVWTGEFREVPEMLSAPLSWKKPRTVFANSMSDLFGEGVANEFIAAVFGVMAATPRHTYQVLTKRAERLPEWFEWIDAEKICAGMERAGIEEICSSFGPMGMTSSPRGLMTISGIPWPLPNVWLGVSVEDKRHGLPRIEHLRRTPAAIRFLSIEPLLEDLGEIDLTGIHWVIVGGESGHRARPCDLTWIRSIIRQCKSAGVPVFVKQLGAYVKFDGCSSPGEHWPTGTNMIDDYLHGQGWRVLLRHTKGGDISEWPEDLWIREMPARFP